MTLSSISYQKLSFIQECHQACKTFSSEHLSERKGCDFLSSHVYLSVIPKALACLGARKLLEQSPLTTPLVP